MLKINFNDLECALRDQESVLKLNVPINLAFPDLQGVGAASQFVGPWAVILASVRWVWLAVLANKSDECICSVLDANIKRSIAASRLAGGNNYRSKHDLFLILASVFSGNRSLIKMAAGAVKVADPAVSEYQYFEAWTGFIRARLFETSAEEAVQRDILLKNRGLRFYQCPSPALIKAFADRDYSKMEKLAKNVFKAEWKKGEDEGLIARDQDGNADVILRSRDANQFWPWAVAAFIKLASFESGKVVTDPLWLPERLVKLSL